MVPLITNLGIQLATLTVMIGTGGPFDLSTLRLFVNPVVFNNTTTLASLTEASFVGYAAVAAQVFGAPYIAPGGVATITAPSVQFTAGVIVTPQTVYGWYLTNAAGTELVAGASFPSGQAVPINVEYDGVVISPNYQFGG